VSLPWNVVYALESTQSRLDKEAILKNVPTESEFWEGAKLALDALITFGVKKLPEIPVHGSGARWKDFVALTDRLRKRELTGNAARDAISAFGATTTEAQWNYWFKRILEKDLAAGVGVLAPETPAAIAALSAQARRLARLETR
jgi:DNA ligase-1